MTVSSRLTDARPVRPVASLRRKSSIAASMRGLVSLIMSLSFIRLVTSYQGQVTSNGGFYLVPAHLSLVTSWVFRGRLACQTQVHSESRGQCYQECAC